MANFQTPWTLWYHDPENHDYSLASYVQVAEVGTPAEFWSVVDSIPKESWDCGMFFFMRKGVRPIWDAPENERGGAWSKKVDAADAQTIFTDMMVYCVANLLLMQHKDILQGITLSPKGAFHIIKIWNSTSTYHDRKLLNPGMKLKIADDVTYTPHKLRPR